MAKYHPIINKRKGVKMTLWEKIKCFFGFCPEINKKSKTIINSVYKVEPKVINVPVKQAEKPVEVILTKEVKKRLKDEIKKVKKVKRHWYNNGKTQKLIPEGEETKLPKAWKKGKVKSKTKDK
jgi:hypothetical protein